MHFFWIQGAVPYLAFGRRRKYSIIPLPAIMFNRCELDTNKNVSTLEVVPNTDPRCETFTPTDTMEMKISSRKDAIGSFICVMVYNHLFPAVALSIRKHTCSNVVSYNDVKNECA